jgi:hypothetical protein
MCNDSTHRVNIIEQESEFKCLGYHISYDRMDPGIKLLSYNKIDGIIKREILINVTRNKGICTIKAA